MISKIRASFNNGNNETFGDHRVPNNSGRVL